ncbi:MAG: CRISPR-associated endoribonuclease Cas6 [Bacillota bacterium]
MVEIKKYKFAFRCTKPGTVFGHGGSECHGLLFAMLEQVNPGFAQIIHEEKENQFSIGPLRGKGKREKGAFYLDDGAEYYFSIASLTADMDTALEKSLAYINPAGKFRLGSADCSWLRAEKLCEAVQVQLCRELPPAKFVINFLSPTCFRSQGISLLFPSPELVFNNLRERWNAFASVPIELFLGNSLYISRYNLKTSTVRFAKYYITGFMGRVEYCFAKGTSEAIRKQIWTLALFSTYSGIGYKTGMGMGEVRVERCDG